MNTRTLFSENEDDGLEGIMCTWGWVGGGLWINCGEPCNTWLVFA